MRLFEGTPWDRPPRCERCGELEEDCACPPPARELTPPQKQTARLAVEKRKKGKVVTVVRGLSPEDNDLAALLGKLKASCGAGGAVKDDLLDNQLAVLEYPRATATVRSALMEVEGGQRRQFVVCGDKGTVDIRPLEPPQVRLALSRPRDELRKGYQDVRMPRYVRYDDDFADLAKIIRGEKASGFPPAHDLAVQESVLLASGLKTGPAKRAK